MQIFHVIFSKSIQMGGKVHELEEFVVEEVRDQNGNYNFHLTFPCIYVVHNVPDDLSYCLVCMLTLKSSIHYLNKMFTSIVPLTTWIRVVHLLFIELYLNKVCVRCLKSVLVSDSSAIASFINLSFGNIWIRKRKCWLAACANPPIRENNELHHMMQFITHFVHTKLIQPWRW